MNGEKQKMDGLDGLATLDGLAGTDGLDGLGTAREASFVKREAGRTDGLGTADSLASLDVLGMVDFTPYVCN